MRRSSNFYGFRMPLLTKNGRPLKKENKLMNSKEKSIWELTFDDLKGYPWSELWGCALGIIVMLGLNILITSGIVNLTYGSIATEGKEQLTFIVTLGYEALILFLSGLVFLKRPVIALVVFIVLYLATWVAVPVTVGRIAPDMTDCERIHTTVQAKDYNVPLGQIGAVCHSYVADRYLIHEASF